MLAEKKGVYQSTLVKAGPVTVTITSDVLKSKDKDSYYVNLKHEGKEHYLVLENDDCRAALENRKGQTVVLEASGSREDAALVVRPAGSQPSRPPPPTLREADDLPGVSHPEGPDRATAYRKAHVRAAQVSVLHVMATRAAIVSAREVHEGGFPVDSQTVQAFANCIFIELARGTDVNALPVKALKPKYEEGGESGSDPESF